MRTALVAVAIVALIAVANAQSCNGVNMTTNIGFDAKAACPYGYIPDTNQGRCITYRQAVNNFLYAPCNLPQDCGPLATMAGAQIMTCGFPDKQCTWSGTRMQNDSCVSNVNCFTYSNITGGSPSTIKHGCDKTTKTCRPQTDKFVAQLGDRCNYDDYADTIRCVQPTLGCSTPTVTSSGNCVQLLDFGQICVGPTVGCRTDAFCMGPFSNNATCQALKQIGETCFTPGSTQECSQAAQPAYCHRYKMTCQPYQTLLQNCSTTFLTSVDVCATGLTCLINQGIPQCMPPLYSNDTCTPGVNSRCAPGLTCITSMTGTGPLSRCWAGNVTDLCTTSTGNPQYPDTCKPGLACVQGSCVQRLPVGGNCTITGDRQCQDGLFCYNKTCTAPQTLGQPCDPINYINPLTRLICSTAYQCSRGVCISNYSLPVDALCANDIDCDTSYCDPMLKRCTRRKMCMSDASCGTGLTCVCNGGLDNLGQCILNNCQKQQKTLLDCLNPVYYDVYANATSYLTSLPAKYVALDSQSSATSKCSNQHNDYVRCQATMHKWGAPSVPLGDVILWDVSTVSGTSTVSASITVMVAFIMSVFLLL